MFTCSQRNPMRIENKSNNRQLPSSLKDRPVAPKLERQTVAASYRDQQLPLATRMNSCPRATRENSWRQQLRELRLKHKKNDTHPKDNSEQMKICQKGDVNREQHRSSDKSHGTMGRQQRKPRTSAKDNRPGHNSYSRTA